MDKEIRNKIQRATQLARHLLEDEYQKQLEGTFDILLDGTINRTPGSHLSEDQVIIREKLVAAIEYKQTTGLKSGEAVDAYLREAAFTTLNRFVAFKMLEARDLVQECVSRGDESNGFKEFAALAPGLAVLPDKGYRLYIETVFDEIGQEVRVLFDRRDTAGLLWPRRRTLHELLDILNNTELAQIWLEDETIGWVYQYFNGDEERTRMRAESQAPRNSHELAVRNQFFTPRYVVQFLTDNTLGRTWFEMMLGETKLADLDYLVRRPNEVFLAEGETAPEQEDDDADLSQKERLKRPVDIPFRAKKDPRDLRILDPACGSGHFLLYALDLLVTIYEEAWNDKKAAVSTLTEKRLSDEYSSLEDLRQHIPLFILKHNLYGIDIDPRAAQIAALALWMRAQRAYNEFGISRDDRRGIEKTNIVVAEPMPGDSALVEEFASGLTPPVLGDLFKKMVDEMKLAGELGSLLKIEEAISESVTAARKQFIARKKELKKGYLPGFTPKQKQGELDLSGISDELFFDNAEEKILSALHVFAESAVGADGVRRRLFSGDSEQGVAFIELMRKKYDVVLMNPPFGNPSTLAKSRLNRDDSGNLYAAFVRLGCEIGDAIGAITDRTFITQATFSKFRNNILLRQPSLNILADLGWGILDANVQVASYIIRKSIDKKVIFFDLRINEIKENSSVYRIHNSILVSKQSFTNLPSSVLAYQIPGPFLLSVENDVALSEIAYLPRGLGSNKAERTYRAWVEVPQECLGIKWRSLANGGKFSPFFRSDLGVADWVTPNGMLWIEMNSEDSWRPYDQSNTRGYFEPGLSFPKQSSSFNVSLLPAEYLPTREGKAILPKEDDSIWWLLSFLNSGPVRGFVRDTCGLHKQSGSIGCIPVPALQHERKLLARVAREIWSNCFESYLYDETSRYFIGPYNLSYTNKKQSLVSIQSSINQKLMIIDDLIAAVFGELGNNWAERAAEPQIYTPNEHDLESWTVGVVFGRFKETPDWSDNAIINYSPTEPPPNIPPAINRTTLSPSQEIYVFDKGHPSDLSSAVVNVFMKQQLSAPTNIRNWLNKKFFETHLERYKIARRKAPIYWQLATPSTSYSVWLYYHRLTRDSFFRVLRDYVAPKLQHEETKFTSLQNDAGENPSTGQRKEIDAQKTFVEELRSFKAEIARIAPLWNPNLNDGVIINFSPLWRLVPQHKPWQKECRKVWDKLVKGDYDWAHLAMHLWPERVVPKCQTDRSLAIAHGLEEEFWHVDDKGKWLERTVDQSHIDELIVERSSTAVKTALDDLLNAPAPSFGRKSKPARKTASRNTNHNSKEN